MDGQAPAPMPARELMEVRSFDDESAASSKISAFTDVLTGAGSVAAAVGAAVAALGFSEEKKETDSVASHLKSVPVREIRRVKSVDTHITDLSNPTQPGRIRTQGSVRPASPSGMVSVDSGSIYLEDQSYASGMGGSESLLSAPLSAKSRSSDDKQLPDPEQSPLPTSASEDALSGSGVEADADADAGTVRSDCPADEGQGVLRPGSASLNRKKPNDDAIPDEPPVKADRTRPIYKGVSVRPSTRSRAGIFSRRQPQLKTFTDDEGDSDGTDQRPKLPINLGPKRSERLKAQRSLSPNNSASTSDESPPKFTTANYYVEEPDDSKLHVSMEGDEDPNLSASERKPRRRSKGKGKRKHKAASNAVAAPHPTESPASDAWNTFLSELTKVESTFFGANAFMSTGESTNEEDTRPDVSISDEESEQLPPQPPRTFYA